MDPSFYNNLFTLQDKVANNAIIGGILIGLASSLYFLMFGNILGINGLAGSIVKYPTQQETKSKALVVIAIVFTSTITTKLHQLHLIDQLPFGNIHQNTKNSPIRLIVSGLLVGIGTQLSNGCISYHELYGMPRFTLRSYAAMITFLSTSFYTVTYCIYEYLPQFTLLENQQFTKISIDQDLALIVCLVIGILLILSKISLFIVGVLFASGAMVSKLSQRNKIFGFLSLNENWDPTLLYVAFSGISVNIITKAVMKIMKLKPFYQEKICNTTKDDNVRLIIGVFLFGFGWGLGGLCPGPYLLLVPHAIQVTIFWALPFFGSQKIVKILTQKLGQKNKIE